MNDFILDTVSTIVVSNTFSKSLSLANSFSNVSFSNCLICRWAASLRMAKVSSGTTSRSLSRVTSSWDETFWDGVTSRLWHVDRL